MMSTPTSQAPSPLAEATEYCPTSARARMAEQQTLFLDIRDHGDHALMQLDVPECVHIPFTELEQRFGELPKERDIVVVSIDGSKSLQATYFLMYQQFHSVANMKMGLLQWVKRDFPTRGDRAAWCQRHPANSRESCC